MALVERLWRNRGDEGEEGCGEDGVRGVRGVRGGLRGDRGDREISSEGSWAILSNAAERASMSRRWCKDAVLGGGESMFNGSDREGTGARASIEEESVSVPASVDPPNAAVVGSTAAVGFRGSGGGITTIELRDFGKKAGEEVEI